MNLFGMIFMIVWDVLYLVLKWDIGGGSSARSSATKE